jgi:hypothetical protein
VTDLTTAPRASAPVDQRGGMRSALRVGRLAHGDHEALVADAVLSSGLRHQCSASWSTSTPRDALDNPESGWTVTASSISGSGVYDTASMVIAHDPAGNLLVAEWEHEHITCRLIARTQHEAASLLATMRRLYPDAQEPDDNAVRVTFWSLSDRDVQRVTRRIAIPTWNAVRANYHSRTRADLETLVDLRPEVASGKLILWHGPPGTGKTWALRALLREWRHWVDANYVLDPEKFFGQSASYMMSVILDQDRGFDDQDEDKQKWRLIILEDAGELLGKDARLEVGQGLGRMLNVCDGLVGQGLRVLVLLTTNEDVGTMHPAVVRRGRCLANIRFDLLSADESRDWAVAHGVAPGDERSTLLADLFAADQIVTRGGAASRTGFQPRT